LGRKERYVLAMVLLLAIGLSAAWAASTDVASISASISGYPALGVMSSVLSPSMTKKAGKWYYLESTNVFDITTSQSFSYNTNCTVLVTLVNAADLADDFSSLDIYVELKTQGGTVLDRGVISLEQGVFSALLNATSITHNDFPLSVRVTASGYARSGNPRDVTLYLACQVMTPAG
jgi:hypothetical protein